ncbi:MAG: hypothetical protein HY854_03120 [Burkholderiales bacterium]|nr:hypothetical protein [Burkholderiales bacterium]
MKASYLIVPVMALLAAGCSFTTSTPAVVAAPSPYYAVAPLADSDMDGTADIYDRYPLDSRFR